MVNRWTIRERLKYDEKNMDDFLAHFCCMPCAICQEYREVKKAKAAGLIESTESNLANQNEETPLRNQS